METSKSFASSSNAKDSQIMEMLKQILHQLTVLSAGIGEITKIEQGKSKSHYTIDEVAAYVRRTAYTVRRWIKEKKICAERVSGTGPKGRLLIPREELDKLIHRGLGGSLPGNPA